MPELPLEINALIAQYIGEDVFRLRHEKLPVDLSSDLILYNAIVQYESHESWSSTKPKLQELGGYKDVKEELVERESLYWAHKRGCPSKLVVSANTRRCYPPDTVLRHGYLMYWAQWRHSETMCVILDILGKRRWELPLLRRYSAVTVTKSAIVVAVLGAEGTYLCTYQLDGLAPGRLDWTECGDRQIISPADADVMAITAHKNAYLILCENVNTLLRLWKDGECRLIGRYDVVEKAAINVDSTAFIYVYCKRNQHSEFFVERHSFDGELISSRSVRTSELESGDQISLRHTGSRWYAALLDRIGSFRSYCMLNDKEARHGARYVHWKGMRYQIDGDDVGISQLGNGISHSSLPGCLRYVKETPSTVLDLIVDDSFLVVLWSDGFGMKWFIFGFETVGMDVSTVPVVGQYHWVPNCDRVSRREEQWTWHG